MDAPSRDGFDESDFCVSCLVDIVPEFQSEELILMLKKVLFFFLNILRFSFTYRLIHV